MKFGQKDAQMSCGFNDFLDKQFLGMEILLTLQDVLVATVILVTIAFGLAFSTKPDMEYTMLAENSLDPLGLVGECWVIRWEDH